MILRQSRYLLLADDDAEDEALETVTLRASGGEYDGVTGAVTVTVEDTDQKGILLSPLSLELDEGGPAGTYTVALRSAPTSNVNGHHHGAFGGGYAGPGVADLHARNLGHSPDGLGSGTG